VIAKESMNVMDGGFDGPRITVAGYFVHEAYKMNDQYCGPRIPPAGLLFERPKNVGSARNRAAKSPGTHEFPDSPSFPRPSGCRGRSF
jgi:hypothetical protein